MSRKSDRPDTATCQHEWVAQTGLEAGTFKCSICRAGGYRNAQMRVPYLRKIKGVPTPAQAAARLKATQIVAYTCRTRTRTAGVREMCKRPAYSMSGCCNLHAPLRPGETDD